MRIWLLALVACSPPNTVTLKAEAASVQLTAEPFSLVVTGENGNAVLTATGLLATSDTPTDMFQFVPGWDTYRPGLAPWQRAAKGEMTRASATSASARYDNMAIDVSVTGGRVSITLLSSELDVVALETTAGAGEHFFGMGERFASVDHRGLGLYSWSEEGGVGAGENMMPARGSFPVPNGASMTYFPVPFFHSTAGYALLLNTSYRNEARFAVAEQPDQLLLMAHGAMLPIIVYTRQDPLKRIDDYTADTGRPMVPAPWVYGVRKRSDAGRVINGVPEYQLMRERHLPITAIDDTAHFLPDNSHIGREDRLREDNRILHEWGYKTVAYNTPYVSASNPRAANEYNYGVENGLFLLGPTGQPSTEFFISGSPQTVAMIDLFSDAGFAWYQQLLKRTVDLGYDGWMNDFGEYTKRDARTADGRLGTELHNLLPVMSAAAAHGLLESVKPNDYWFFVRSGYIGSQQFAPQVWGGDSEASFDDTQGLPSAVRGGLNLGFVGVWQYGSDVTGFKCVSGGPYDKEVFIRWLQFGAVSPLYHEEDACANPLKDENKWVLWNDDETQDAWRMTASFHTRIAPYLRTLAVEANKTGKPVMLHPFLTHPNERDGWAVEDSYFFGPSLYAAPVVRRGVTTRHVWLPPGRYVEWTEKTVHSGPAFVDVPAPLMRLPMFLVENTILPMLDADVQTLAPTTIESVVSEAKRADVLDIVAALGPNGRAEMTMYDGAHIVLSRDASTPQGERVGDVTRVVFEGTVPAGITAQVEGTNKRMRFEVLATP